MPRLLPADVPAGNAAVRRRRQPHPAVARNITVRGRVDACRSGQHYLGTMIGTGKGRAAMAARIATLVSGLVMAGCSVVGVRDGTEEPRYTVEQVTHGLEIRRYGPRIAAETTITADEEAARNAGFRRLAGYIFGANRGGAKIAMTAPVTQQPGEAAGGAKIAMTAPVSQATGPGGAWVIRFFMPAEWTMDTLPAPNDPAVKLVPVPAETVAVLRFTGDRGPDAVAAHTTDLLRALEDTAWRPTGTPVAWFYDPPWTIPFLRRNEVAVPVAAR
jgi:hypothetical protein